MIMEFAALCLATTIYFEARGEPVAGQFAVAHVAMNRAKKRKTSVCYQALRRKQFSWVNGKTKTKNQVILAAFNKPSDLKAWKKNSRVAILILKGSWDTTGGATHYHEITIKPRWAAKMQRTATIGNHHFYKEKKMRKGPGRKHQEPGITYTRKDKLVFHGKHGYPIRKMGKMERQAQAAMLTTNRTH